MATSSARVQRPQALYKVDKPQNISDESALCQFGADVCLYGFSTFLPIIIEAMGYTAVKAQYLTIPGSSSIHPS
jgi:hypothetical protein